MTDPVYLSLELLRNDAIARGMQGLAIVYGWALIRMAEKRTTLKNLNG